MITPIAVTAGDIWLEIDKSDGIYKEVLFTRMTSAEKSHELLLMALGWLVYQKHVRWVPGEKGGRLFLINPDKEKEDSKHEKSNQNRFASSSA
jgi:hypothetical protein